MANEAEINVQEGTLNFLAQGGVFRFGVTQMRKDGRLPRFPVHHEYPKLLRLSDGVQEFDRETETCRNTTVKWVEKREVFRDILVDSEEEEERVLGGGKTSVQIEADRQGLLQRCRSLGIPADAAWTAVRLRRELGDKLDAPDDVKPADKMAALESELAMLRRMSEMQTEIDRLRVSLQPVQASDEDIAQLRNELATLGVKVDGRWSATRLRDELDRATSSHGRSA
jgi:hypothetical protein